MLTIREYLEKNFKYLASEERSKLINIKTQYSILSKEISTIIL